MGVDDIPELDRMCRRFPETPVIIDHVCGIRIRDGSFPETEVRALSTLARHKRVLVKLGPVSGLGRRACALPRSPPADPPPGRRLRPGALYVGKRQRRADPNGQPAVGLPGRAGVDPRPRGLPQRHGQSGPPVHDRRAVLLPALAGLPRARSPLSLPARQPSSSPHRRPKSARRRRGSCRVRRTGASSRHRAATHWPNRADR